MQDKLTVSIIGAGNIAGGFDEKKTDDSIGIFSHAGAYKKSDKFILKNIFDIDTKRAKEFQQYWNVENICKKEEDIISDYQDIISICSPDKFHFQTLKSILENKSCKTIFVEKPLGLNSEEVGIIYHLSQKSDINIVVNFQRHFDDAYSNINLINNKILSVNCYYIKGLNHIGITMIDTIIMILGFPKDVYTYNKIYNKDIKDYTYEFILFYDNFNVTIKSIDEENNYNYHIFDIDILTKNGRYIFTDNGNTVFKYNLSNYFYSDVKVLTDKPTKTRTNYANSMILSVQYLYDITVKNKIHNTNTVFSSYNNHLLLEKIIKSFEKQKRLTIEDTLWKK